jgi:hypothetical protein
MIDPEKGILQPVRLRMMRLQRWENGPYFADFSLHIPDTRSFLRVREIVKICIAFPSFLSNRCFAIAHLSPTGCQSNPVRLLLVQGCRNPVALEA